VQDISDSQSLPDRAFSSSVAAMRALSNTSLVEEAAKKALSAHQLERTLERFRQLCTTPGDDVTELESVAEIVRNAGFKQELMVILREALSLPEANPHVGALWIRRIVSSKIWDHKYPSGLDNLCRQGEIGRRAVIEFLELAGNKRRYELVQQCLTRHAKWLRTDPKGWKAAGCALVQARCYRHAARWMSAWQDRPDLDLPTLYSVALAMRASGRTRQANEAVRAALAKPGAFEQFPIFKLWEAQDKAFAGQTQEASAIFKQINPVGWEDDSLAVFYLVRSVIRVQKAEKSNRREAFTVAQDRIADLFRRIPIYKRDVFLRRQYRRCLARMAMQAGNWPRMVRVFWRSAESWPFVVPLLLIPGLQFWLPCYLYRLCSRRKGVSK
jgi:hypothetical protein